MRNPKFHFYLAATKVVFETPQGEPGMSEHNCVLRWDNQKLGTAAIGKIQQLAQFLLRKNVAPDPSYQVRDVFILGISYLGFMSEQEFEDTSGLEQPDQPAPKPAGHALLNPAVDPFELKQGEQRNVPSTGSGGS